MLGSALADLGAREDSLGDDLIQGCLSSSRIAATNGHGAGCGSVILSGELPSVVANLWSGGVAMGTWGLELTPELRAGR